jgi:ATP-binding cassette subfamily F protein 3
VELAADRLWLVADGTCNAYEGDLEDYRRLLLDAARAERRQARGAKPKASVNKADERRRRAEARTVTANLRKAIKTAEARVGKLQAEKDDLHARLANPKLYDGPAGDVTALNKRAGEVDRDIETAEAAWLEAQEALEASENSDAG